MAADAVCHRAHGRWPTADGRRDGLADDIDVAETPDQSFSDQPAAQLVLVFREFLCQPRKGPHVRRMSQLMRVESRKKTVQPREHVTKRCVVCGA